MREPIGGFIFVEVNKMDYEELIDLTFNTFDLHNHIFEVKVEEQDWSMPTDHILSNLRESSNGLMEVRMVGLYGYTSFKKNIRGYNIIGIRVYQREFLNLPSVDTINQFQVKWIDLCDKSQADFGYFGNSPSQSEDEYIHNEILIPLLSYDISYLVNKNFWMTYIGQQILPRWKERIFFENDFDIENLSSRSILICGGAGYNPVTGDHGKE